jgi:hypothetical protein
MFLPIPSHNRFQTLFPDSALARLYIRNSTGIIIFKFKTDGQGESQLIRKIFPFRYKKVFEALHHAVKVKPVGGYLFIDTSPTGLIENFRVRNFLTPLNTDRAHEVTAITDPKNQFLYLDD